LTSLGKAPFREGPPGGGDLEYDRLRTRRSGEGDRDVGDLLRAEDVPFGAASAASGDGSRTADWTVAAILHWITMTSSRCENPRTAEQRLNDGCESKGDERLSPKVLG